MPTFLDVGAVRIQPYLARTPDLRLRRGASWMLVRATRPEAVGSWIASAGLAGVTPNPDAGHADGVVSLRIPEGSGPEVATRLLLHLRTQVPAAQWRAWWATTDTYLAATVAAHTETVEELVSLPPAADFTLGRTCESCRVDLRVDGDHCPDCHARDEAAGRRRTPTNPNGADEEPDALGTERDLLDAVTEKVGRRLGVVPDLGRLAAMGEEDGNRNHIATVAFDGNAMGAFFQKLSDLPDTNLKKVISPLVSQATRDALVAATHAAVRSGDRHLPVVPHVVGGDDVVASAVADRAWEFTTTFLTRFDTKLAATTHQLDLPDQLRAALPSMSAGIVFAQHKFPYNRAVHLAEQVLRRAKQDTGGATPAMRWLDVTADGEQAPPWRRTFTRGQVEDLDNELRVVAGIGQSGRQELARLLGAGTDEQAAAAALVWARRNRQPAVANLLDQWGVTGTRNAVAMCRWWRP